MVDREACGVQSCPRLVLCNHGGVCTVHTGQVDCVNTMSGCLKITICTLPYGGEIWQGVNFGSLASLSKGRQFKNRKRSSYVREA